MSGDRVPLAVAAGVAAGATVPFSALVFTGLYEVGGTADIALLPLAAAMIGIHVLIGVGEAILTALVVRAVLSSRPDLVFAAPRPDVVPAAIP
jgi:cobalt/nickel transport system permease protein